MGPLSLQVVVLILGYHHRRQVGIFNVGFDEPVFNLEKQRNPRCLLNGDLLHLAIQGFALLRIFFRRRLIQKLVHVRVAVAGVVLETVAAEENIQKIFDTFFTTKDSVKDVGLGLSVCYGFIKEHGGDIKVSSKRGSGTTFTVILPISKQDAP